GLNIDATPSSATSYDQLTQQVIADRAAGRENNLIVVGLDQVNFWVSTLKPQPLDASKLPSTYDQRFLALGAVNGTNYIAPYQVSFPALFTNTTLTTKAGLDAKTPPKTMSEFASAAAKVKASVNGPSAYLPTDGVADWVAQGVIQSGGAQL